MFPALVTMWNIYVCLTIHTTQVVDVHVFVVVVVVVFSFWDSVKYVP